MKPDLAGEAIIPKGLSAYFQEYNLESLSLEKDSDLIIQRTLEFGTWDEVHWLFSLYGVENIRAFLRRRGERWLKPVSFNYWRKLLNIRRWRHSPFPTHKGEIWNL